LPINPWNCETIPCPPSVYRAKPLLRFLFLLLLKKHRGLFMSFLRVLPSFRGMFHSLLGMLVPGKVVSFGVTGSRSAVGMRSLLVKLGRSLM
jgi:hypothetical protein